MAKRARGEAADADAAADSAIERHQALMRVYANASSASATHSNSTNSSSKRAMGVSHHDMDVIRAHFQFLRDDDADAERGEADWQVRMSVRYYRRLFREYALADLSRFQEGKIGLRWRTESEVVSGKGQFVCGNKRCDARVGLRSYELLFAYVEQRETKRCLVKVRACEQCAAKIFYKKLQQLEHKKEKKKSGKKKRTKHGASGENEKKRRRSDSDSDSDGSSDDNERIHRLCAEINARETRASRQSTAAPGDEATGGESSVGFFEDRKGDTEVFSDLLV